MSRPGQEELSLIPSNSSIDTTIEQPTEDLRKHKTRTYSNQSGPNEKCKKNTEKKPTEILQRTCRQWGRFSRLLRHSARKTDRANILWIFPPAEHSTWIFEESHLFSRLVLEETLLSTSPFFTFAGIRARFMRWLQLRRDCDSTRPSCNFPASNASRTVSDASYSYVSRKPLTAVLHIMCDYS